MASFITTADFNVLVKEAVMQWSELPLNIIYKIKRVKEVLVDNTATVILDLSNEQGDTLKVWAPQMLYKDLLRFPDKTNIYLRSLGKKECKMTPGRYYYGYNMAQVVN